MKLTKHEATAALANVEDARAAMRHAIRAHRGHHHLWIWGLIWMIMPGMAMAAGDSAARWFFPVCVAGAIASTIVGITQSRQLRAPVNLRFLAVLATVVAFGTAFPFVLDAPASVRPLYAYTCLVCMQGYVIGGLWTDTYLVWLGLIVSLLILLGTFAFPELFWPWMAVCGGGSLLLSGFYVRHVWR